MKMRRKMRMMLADCLCLSLFEQTWLKERLVREGDLSNGMRKSHFLSSFWTTWVTPVSVISPVRGANAQNGVCASSTLWSDATVISSDSSGAQTAQLFRSHSMRFTPVQTAPAWSPPTFALFPRFLLYPLPSLLFGKSPPPKKRSKKKSERILWTVKWQPEYHHWSYCALCSIHHIWCFKPQPTSPLILCLVPLKVGSVPVLPG